MTIVIAQVNDQRAIVCVDTATSIAGGQSARASKAPCTTVWAKLERGLFVAPVDDDVVAGLDLKEPASDADYLRLAAEQVAIGRALGTLPPDSWGGRLLKAEIARGVFTCRDLGPI